MPAPQNLFRDPAVWESILSGGRIVSTRILCAGAKYVFLSFCQFFGGSGLGELGRFGRMENLSWIRLGRVHNFFSGPDSRTSDITWGVCAGSCLGVDELAASAAELTQNRLFKAFELLDFVRDA